MTTAVGWQRRLDEASELEDVVLVANDFLAPWTPDEIAALPEHCRPSSIANAQHLNAYALKLTHFHCSADPRAASDLRRMTAFFTKAALRVYQILEQTGEFPLDAKARERGTGRARS